MTVLNETSDRFERAKLVVPLLPWATPGWSGYCRSVRDNLDDARHSELNGDGGGAEFWIDQATDCARRKCDMNAFVRYVSAGELVISESRTVRDEWENNIRSPIFRPFAWPVPRHHEIAAAAPDLALDVLNQFGVPIRVVFWADGECKVNHHRSYPGQPLVEFFDLRYPFTEHGQYIAGYFLDTFNERWGGINLWGDVHDWTMDDQAMAPVRLWLEPISGVARAKPAC